MRILDELKSVSDEPDDIFICAASFELERSLAVLGKLGDYRARRAFIVAFDSKKDQRGQRLREESLVALQEGLCEADMLGSPRVLKVGARDFLALWEQVFDDLKMSRVTSQRLTATIDVSCLTRVQLVYALREVIKSGRFRRLRVVYTEAGTFNTSRGDKYNRLSRGEFSPRVYPLNATLDSTATSKRAALVVVGLEGQRTQCSWRHLEPDTAFLLFGAGRRELTNTARRENALLFEVASSGGGQVHRLPTVALESAAVAVRDWLGQLPGRGYGSVGMIPFGPKPLVMGSVLALLASVNIKSDLVYAMAAGGYNSYYSSGAGSTYWADLSEYLDGGRAAAPDRLT